MSITRSYLQNPTALASAAITDYRDWQIPLGRRFRALKIWFVIRTYGVRKMQEMVRRHIKLGELFGELVQERSDLFEIVAGPQFALTLIRCKVRKQNGVNQHAQELLGNSVSRTGETQKEADAEMNDFNRKLATADLDAENALTKKVCEAANASGELFVTGAVADGVYVIRVVSANELADEEHIRKAFKLLEKLTLENQS